ncbi:hypothetical protein, partial, partial [Parasitella parasitica]
VASAAPVTEIEFCETGGSACDATLEAVFDTSLGGIIDATPYYDGAVSATALCDDLAAFVETSPVVNSKAPVDSGSISAAVSFPCSSDVSAAFDATEMDIVHDDLMPSVELSTVADIDVVMGLGASFGSSPDLVSSVVACPLGQLSLDDYGVSNATTTHCDFSSATFCFGFDDQDHLLSNNEDSIMVDAPTALAPPSSFVAPTFETIGSCLPASFPGFASVHASTMVSTTNSSFDFTFSFAARSPSSMTQAISSSTAIFPEAVTIVPETEFCPVPVAPEAPFGDFGIQMPSPTTAAASAATTTTIAPAATTAPSATATTITG